MGKGERKKKVADPMASSARVTMQSSNRSFRQKMGKMGKEEERSD